MQPNLETVRTLAQKHRDVITEGGLRWEIFNEKSNGLAESGAIASVVLKYRPSLIAASVCCAHFFASVSLRKLAR